jgi:hypothetical protein
MNLTMFVSIQFMKPENDMLPWTIISTCLCVCTYKGMELNIHSKYILITKEGGDGYIDQTFTIISVLHVYVYFLSLFSLGFFFFMTRDSNSSFFGANLLNSE